MSSFNSLIDPTDFGLVAHYLGSPTSEIRYVVHTPAMEQLSPVAEFLTNLQPRIMMEHEFHRHLNRLAADWGVRISCRHPTAEIHPAHQLDAREIPRLAQTWVIYLPPCYLAHTPGLFEGKLIRPQLDLPPAVRRGHGIKT